MSYTKKPPAPFSFASGFTLVELAISLMVIGLLLGGILKGRELIDNAKVTALFKQIKTYDAATYAFQDRFGGLPGDIPSADTVIPKCETHSAICLYNGTSGDGNRIVGGISASDAAIAVNYKQGEYCKFFTHLFYAGMIDSEFGSSGTCYTTATSKGADKRDKSFFPLSPFSDTLIVLRSLGDSFSSLDSINDYDPDGHYYDVSPLTIFQAHAVDKKFDDGYALNGQVLMVPDFVTCHDEKGVYNLQADNPKSGSCQVLVRASF